MILVDSQYEELLDTLEWDLRNQMWRIMPGYLERLVRKQIWIPE